MDRFRLAGAFALAALVAGGTYRAGARLPELEIDRGPLREHVEAAAKRAHFQAAARVGDGDRARGRHDVAGRDGRVDGGDGLVFRVVHAGP